MLAPRRVGKTSILYRLVEDAPGNSYSALYIDLSGTRSESEFVDALARAVQFHTTRPATDAPALTGHWRADGNRLLTHLTKSPSPWLILLDELALFVQALLDESHLRAKFFLQWWNAARVHHTRLDQLRWICCGSIGLDTLAARACLDQYIADLTPFTLGAFSHREADALLARLGDAYNLPLSRSVRGYLIERTGWLIPYHLQVLFAALRRHCEDNQASPSRRAVDATWEDLLNPTARRYFDHWRQRLRANHHPRDAEWAGAVLAHIARGPDQGVPRGTIEFALGPRLDGNQHRRGRLRARLNALQSEGYIVLVSGYYRFRSNLLRDYWRRRII